MEFNEVVGLLANNGIGIVCLIYFMWRDSKYMQKIADLLSSLNAKMEEYHSENNF